MTPDEKSTKENPLQAKSKSIQVRDLRRGGQKERQNIIQTKSISLMKPEIHIKWVNLQKTRGHE